MKAINELARLSDNVKIEIRRALLDCADSGWYVLGKNVASFEEEFARYTGTARCVSVANGTDALEISLKALGVKAGDRVVTVANAGFYSSIGILACGAEPVYADIDPRTYTMSPDSLRDIIDGDIKAVILTHLYGQVGDVPAVLGLCREHGVPLVEDCAQAHGARHAGYPAGSFGDVSCFSFYPTKNLGAMGDGGALCTSDPALAERVAALRQYGWGKKYSVDIPRGRNSRLDEIQASILRVKLRYLDQWNHARRTISDLYDERIANPCVTRRPAVSREGYVAHLYVLEAPNRAGLMAWLKGKGIPFDVHYPIPDHRQAVFGGKYDGLRLENTERACDLVLTLPCFPEMTEQDAAEVIDVVNGWGKK